MAAADDRARINLAAKRLEELTENTHSVRERGPNRRGDSKVGPGVKDVYRGASPVSNRPGNDETGDRNGPYTPRQHRSALGEGGEELSGGKPTRRRAQRVSEGSTQTDRKTSRSSLAVVHPVQQKGEEFVLKYIKKALAYAGFDVSSDARSLTQEEIDRYRPDLVQFIANTGVAINWALTHSNRNHEECEIWLFDDSEAVSLANIWLKRAKTIGWMAEVSRQVHHVEDLGDAKDIATILGKRIAATPIFIANNGGMEFWLTNKQENQS